MELRPAQPLRRELDAVCGLLFRATTDDAIISLLGLLSDAITKTVATKDFRESIDTLGLGWKAGLDETIDGKIDAATRRYLESLPTKIGNRDIETPEGAEAVSAVVDGEKKFVVVAGGAGGGKSATITRIIQAAKTKDWPVLAFRLDRFLDIQTMGDLGSVLLDRDESPVGAVGNRFHDRDALVVIDQVDAVSEASGRSGLIRDLLFQLIADSEHFQKLHVVLACRSYDLANDSRLKPFSTSERATSVVLKSFDWERDVLPMLENVGAARPSFSERERRNLSVPINLQLFVTIAESGTPFVGEVSNARLFDRLLEIRAKEFRDKGVTWTPSAALGLIAQSMSANQELTAPESVLMDLPGAVPALSSSGLISAVGGRIQFAHESFFDHSFSNHFLASGQTVLALLLSDEQRLFRRTQVRQIFARLRDQGVSRFYQQNLDEVMNSDRVRYLVKDAIGLWLATIEEPTDRERILVARWFAADHPLTKIGRTVFTGKFWLPSLIRGGLIGKWSAGSEEDKTFAFWILKKNAVSHAPIVNEFLRTWSGGDLDRSGELLDWFATLYPDGDIGELETLYGELVATAPLDRLDETKLTESFELGSWVHKSAELGARVLGMWLRRWLEAFPSQQPFERHIPGNDNYWFQELGEKAPKAFLEEVVPAFAESLRRDLVAIEGGAPPALHLPYRGSEEGYLTLLTKALEERVRHEPTFVERLLALLPPGGQVATYLRLKVIAASGQPLAHLLPSLFTNKELMDLGESGSEWLPFAQAAHACMPFLSPSDRVALEALVLAQKPEIDWALEYMQRREEFAATGWGRDWKPYVLHQLNLSGAKERALLRIISPENLSPMAQARLAELDRKFPNTPLPEAHGIRGGFVQSPISSETAERMSNAQWLKAMKRYATDGNHEYRREAVIGGARQLSSVLQAQAKTEPERFVAMLETLPDGLNDAYAEAIISGLREADATPELTARAILLILNRQGEEFRRTICWTIQKYPAAAADPRILRFVLDVARSGSASDTAVTTKSNEAKNLPKTSMRELLNGESNWEMSGINGERGAAYEALAKVLWDLPDTYESIANFVEQQVDSEPLNSVRFCMLHTINSIAKYDGIRAVTLAKRLADLEPRLLLCGTGRHFLSWAIYAHPDQFISVIDDLSTAPTTSLQALGRVLESGLALTDEARESRFLAKFQGDPLARQAAGYRASGNLTNDSVGDRAARWIEPLFEDEGEVVRKEASHIEWASILTAAADRGELVRAYVNSRTFDDHSDRLMRALSERVDQFPDLTLEALRRVLNLDEVRSEEGRRNHMMTFHGLGRTLVKLYRAFEGDLEREKEMLDLFDLYLARDLYDMRTEMEAYERH